jgi:hypothetical protein
MAQKLRISLLQRFNVLLLPYIGREVPSMLDVIGIAKFVRRGSGSLEDRRELLHNTLALLWDKNVDLQVVFDALLKAKQEKVRAYLNGHRIDTRRDFNEDRKKAVQGLKDARRFLIDCGNESDEAALAKIAAAIDDHRWPGPRRRSRAGHQPEPWVKEARNKLARLKIAKELREDLLSASGLTPYRSN